MALETATYINQLVTTNPLGSDPLADADGHLRLIKSVLKTTFPNITGAMTSTQAQLNSPFPAGGIIMWSGSTGSIPSGWLLCDGNNGTPNLRDRFVIGAGNAFAVGATGGSATISAANLPAHTHTFSGNTGGHSNDHAHYFVTNAAGSHSHNIPNIHYEVGPLESWAAIGNTNRSTNVFTTDTQGNHQHDGWTSGTNANHTHGFSGTTSSVGNGTAYYPPYYALAFIMKAAY